MPRNPHAFLPGASKKLEALSDGVFAIACTLVVIEIKAPHFGEAHGLSDQWQAFIPTLWSIAAFVFSFLNILVFWTNYDAINKVIVRYDTKTTYLNIVFLLFISLIPFTTIFIREEHTSFIAIAAYGLVLMIASLIALWMYYHLAFKAKLFYPEVTMKSRNRVYRQIVSGPILFAVGILLGLISPYISIAIYAITPVSFMFLPQLDFDSKKEELSKEQHQ